MQTLISREIQRLESAILTQFGLVEERVQTAIRAAELRDPALAQQVIDGDDAIDLAEVEIEESCLKTLALYQPVAGDLRYVVMVLKINNDLERIGDLAVNVAKRVRHLAKRPEIEVPFDLQEITARACEQLKKSLDACVESNAEKAREVLRDDEQIDSLYKSGRRRITKAMKSHPNHISSLLDYLWILRSCERIGDHATNIAEDVLFLIRGALARHQKAAGPDSPPQQEGESAGQRPLE